MVRFLTLPLALFAAFVASSARAAETVSLALSSNTVGTLHVTARLGQAVPADFLLDTGSAYVVLSADTRRRLESEGSLQPVRKLRAVMANNATVSAPVYRVSALELAPGCVVRDFEAVALPGARKNILGLSALRAVAPFTINLEPSRLDVTCTALAALPGTAVTGLTESLVAR